MTSIREWTRQAFASRPDNVVVQRFAGPPGTPLDVRITLQRTVIRPRGAAPGRLAGDEALAGAGQPAAPFAGTWLIACSAMAVMVKLGLTPGFPGMMEPSMM